MSGTSFDGVDAAIIKTDGKYYIKRIETDFVKYSNSFLFKDTPVLLWLKVRA